MVERLRGHHFWVVSFFVVVFPRGRGKKSGGGVVGCCSWAASERASKMEKRTFAFLISC